MRILLLGALPPPVHGLSVMNKAVAAALSASGHELTMFSMEPKPSHGVIESLRSSARVVLGGWKAMLCYAQAPKNAFVYMTVSGGYGQLREWPVITLARVLGLRLVVHHHSFRYLDAPFWPSRVVFALLGREARHVVLGPTMGIRLRGRYKARGIFAISNSAFLPVSGSGALPARQQNRRYTVLHLSNLCVEKGLFDVIELARAARDRPRLRFVLAGPVARASDREAVEKACCECDNLTWMGAVYGAAKAELLARSDLFVFPTRYVNEAEPVVVLEALAHGMPVVAIGRGEIPHLIGSDAGKVARDEEKFARVALRYIDEVTADATAFGRAREAARSRYKYLQESARRAREGWLDLVFSSDRSTIV